MHIFKLKINYVVYVVHIDGQFEKHNFSSFSHDETQFKKPDIFLQQCAQIAPTAM